MVTKLSRTLAAGAAAAAWLIVGACGAQAGVSTWTSPLWSNQPSAETAISAADASGGATQLYLTAIGRGIYSSPDGGATWQAQLSGPHDVASVTAAPGDPSVAYADETGPAGGIYRTGDGGETWQAAGLAGGGGPVTVDPVNADVAYVLVSPSDLERTANGGASWSPVTMPDATGVVGLAIDPSGTDVYAGTEGPGTGASGGLYKAPVAGGSWTAVSTTIGCSIHAIAFDRTNANDILVGGSTCAPTFATIWRSTDGGAHFSTVFTINGASLISSLAVDSTGQHVIATGNHNWFSSADGGATFQAASTPPDSLANDSSVTAVDGASGTFLAGGISDLVISADGGQTWQKDDPGLRIFPAYSLATSPAVPGTVYAGSRELGVVTSVGNTDNWFVSAGPPPWDVESMAADANGSTVYAGTGDGLWVSTDSGASWTPSVQLATGEVTALAADPAQPGVVFAAVYGSTPLEGGLWRSLDAGATWQSISAGLPGHAFTALAVDTTTHKVFVAVDGEGVYESDERAVGWSPEPVSPHVDALAVDASGAVYAGACTSSGAVAYVILADLVSAERDLGLDSNCVTGLAADPKVPGLIYASTFGDGVFAYNDVSQDWSPLDAGLLDSDLDAITVNGNGGFAHVAGSQGVSDYRFSADIWTDVEATPSTITVGQPITIVGSFENDGPDDATDVTGVVTLPAGATAPSTVDPTGNISCSGGHVVVCTAHVLPGGTGFGFTAQLTLPSAGVYGTSTTITDTRLDPILGDAASSTSITVSPPATPASPAARDTTAPAGLRIGGAQGAPNPLAQPFQRSRSIVLSWAAEDSSGVATYDVRVRVASPHGRFGAYTTWERATTSSSRTYRGLAGTNACFGLRATDKAGNVSPWTSDSCTTFPLAAASLAKRGPWSRAHEHSAPFTKALSSSTRGASLMFAGAHPRQIALLADRCPGCGKVVVSLGGRRIATVDLAAAHRQAAALVLLAPTRRSGSLVISVASSRRPVRIDAIELRAP